LVTHSQCYFEPVRCAVLIGGSHERARAHHAIRRCNSGRLRRGRKQAAKPPTIGFLGADAAAFAPWTAAFVAHLRELGWIEGRTIAIEYRWSEGRTERYAEIAAEFVRLKVDVI
jgi:hypothetical protein